MSQTKPLFTVEYVSDRTCGEHRNGTIETNPDRAIKDHIRRWGHVGYESLISFFEHALQVTKVNEPAQMEMNLDRQG